MKFNYSLLFIVFLFSSSFVFAQKLNCQANKAAGVTASIYYSPENLRSDTIDILQYTINLNITDFINKKIKGNTIIHFAPKINNQSKISLDLLKMTIDSIKQSSGLLSYNYNDTLLRINLTSALNTTDTSDVTVYYQGIPQGDPSGWGGFSFSGNYAYNLGVGFGAKPHNYGRVWFPCFDNFVEKSLYEFNITTNILKTSFCNGQLISDVTNGSFHTRKWILNKEIPSYLASVAVADYTQVNWNINAANGNLPIVLAARPSDTVALKNGFLHLPNAILGYENYYGPYVWNRVGYCLVPFNSGAMEHATNISYPQAATSIAYESQLMAHELSHHWWGDLMTCETQEDMWLNEGMASYSERLFLEWTYSYSKYLAEVKLIHDEVVKFVHLKEKGFRAISGVPHAYTYGDHVYRKGADVAHTLRSYMGDTAFFAGLKYVLQQKAYKNMNSLEFRDLLQTSSGQNLVPFFDNWVMNGGWPHFSIDSVKTSGTSAPFTCVVYVKQKLFGAPALYSNVPLEVTFMNGAWNKEIKKIYMSGAAQSFTVNTMINPVYVGMNVGSKISDAISSEYRIIKTNAAITYTLGRATFIVSNNGVDSSYIRVEHNFVKPDPFKNNIYNFRLNSQHYWKADGILSPGFVSKIRLNYDGNKSMSGNSYLDTCLTVLNGDSIILLYRKNAADDWREVKNYTKFKISSKTGFFTVDTFKLGEYVFANGHSNILTGVSDSKKNKDVQMVLYPNPATSILNINIDHYKLSSSAVIEIYDMQGKMVKHINTVSSENVISISDLSKGQYIINLTDKSKIITAKMVVLE
ncbi:MAG: T9SS type A sorting domain-containing protein [Burkholderiales bacterium]|nr:T9SS type A sorting domain-containing protein [Bacteroidia bacterium]